MWLTVISLRRHSGTTQKWRTSSIPSVSCHITPSFINLYILKIHKEKEKEKIVHRNSIKEYNTLCLNKGPIFKLCVTLSNFNWFSKFLHCWKAYKICLKSSKPIWHARIVSASVKLLCDSDRKHKNEEKMRKEKKLP